MKYEEPKMKLIKWESDDIITASVSTGKNEDSNTVSGEW